MSKFVKQICIASFGVILVLSFLLNSFGQRSNKEILDQQINWNLANPNVYQTCAILAAKGVSIGFEDTPYFDDSKNNKIINIQSGTLREILDSLIKQDPDYKWKVRDGVISIYSVRSGDNILKTLLNTKLQSFSSKKEGGRRQIADKIYNSESVKKNLKFWKIDLGIATYFELGIPNETKDIDVSEINLRSLLNKIVKDSSDGKLWLIQKSRAGDIYLFF